MHLFHPYIVPVQNEKKLNKALALIFELLICHPNKSILNDILSKPSHEESFPWSVGDASVTADVDGA